MQVDGTIRLHFSNSHISNMHLLVIVSLIGAVYAEPQAIMPMGYGIMAPHPPPSIFPLQYSTIPTTSIHPIPTTMLTTPGMIPMGQNIIYPSLDITMGRSSTMMPKPVEDTAEVKKAKMDFEMAYNKALMTMPESTPVVRAKRDVSRILPYGYSLPYPGYLTPYSHYAHPDTHIRVIPQNIVNFPYYTHH